MKIRKFRCPATLPQDSGVYKTAMKKRFSLTLCGTVRTAADSLGEWTSLLWAAGWRLTGIITSTFMKMRKEQFSRPLGRHTVPESPSERKAEKRMWHQCLTPAGMDSNQVPSHEVPRTHSSCPETFSQRRPSRVKRNLGSLKIFAVQELITKISNITSNTPHIWSSLPRKSVIWVETQVHII